MGRTRTDVFWIGRETQSAGRNDARRPFQKVNNFIRNIIVLCSLLKVLIVNILRSHTQTHSLTSTNSQSRRDVGRRSLFWSIKAQEEHSTRSKRHHLLLCCNFDVFEQEHMCIMCSNKLCLFSGFDCTVSFVHSRALARTRSRQLRLKRTNEEKKFINVCCCRCFPLSFHTR